MAVPAKLSLDCPCAVTQQLYNNHIDDRNTACRVTTRPSALQFSASYSLRI